MRWMMVAARCVSSDAAMLNVIGGLGGGAAAAVTAATSVGAAADGADAASAEADALGSLLGSYKAAAP